MSFGRRPFRNTDDDPDVDAVDEDPVATARRAYHAAIKLLGARDHSTAELTRKLADRDFAPDIIDGLLEELRGANYLDDERYAVTYVEQRIARGYGPRAIENKLRERGIDSALVAAAFDAAAPDWEALAEEALARKFRSDQIVGDDQKARARLARFLQGRGFRPGDAIRAIQRARVAVSTCRSAAADPDP